MVTIPTSCLWIGIILFSIAQVVVTDIIYSINTDKDRWNGWRSLSNSTNSRLFTYNSPSNSYTTCLNPSNVTTWLISPEIQAVPTDRLFISVNFTSACFVPQCTRILKLNYLLNRNFANELVDKTLIGYQEDADKLPDIQSYNDEQMPKQLQVIPLNPTSKSSYNLQILLADRFGCPHIHSVQLWHIECPRIQKDDVVFPFTQTNNQVVIIFGDCIQLQGITLTYKPATMVCNPNGTWTNFNNSCPCFEGQERINGDCSDCQPGYYKSQISTGKCSLCPSPLTSLYPGSHICYCPNNKVLAANRCNNYTCNIIPTVTYDSITLSWSSIISDVANNTMYIVSLNCKNNCSPDCNTTIRKELNGTSFTFTDLCIEASYQISITPEIILKTDRREFRLRKEPCRNRSITTLSGKPTHPPINLNVQAHINSTNVTISWDPPSSNNGALIEEYGIFYWLLDANQNQVQGLNGSKSVERLSFTITLNILRPQSPYLIQVKAWNKFGEGPMISARVTTYNIVTPKPTTSTPSTIAISTKNTQSSQSFSNSVGSDFSTSRPTQVISTTTTINSTSVGYLPSTMPSWLLGIIISSVVLLILILAIVGVVVTRKRNFRKKTLKHYTGVDITLNDVNHATYVDPADFGDMEEAIKRLAKKLPNAAIRIEDKIGEGQFGSVSRAVWTKDSGEKIDVAVKSIKEDCTLKAKKDFLMEAAMIVQFEHRNIVRVEGVVLSKGRLKMIVMEYLANKSLDNYLRENNHKFTKLQLAGMASGVAAGMEYLSDKGFIHRDLAARNVLVGDMMLCKIADFGLSREVQQDNEEDQAQYTTEGGQIALRWTEPEAIISRGFTTASDIWSYGITLWEIFSYAARPYGEWGNKKIMHYVNQGYRLAPPEKCPRCIYSLMLRCQLNDRSKRPTFSNIVQFFDNLFRLPDDLDVFVDTNVADISISSWLEDLKLECYVRLFVNSNIVNVKNLLVLNEKRLTDMGITSLNHIKKILKAIQSDNEIDDSDEDHDYTLLEKEC